MLSFQVSFFSEGYPPVGAASCREKDSIDQVYRGWKPLPFEAKVDLHGLAVFEHSEFRVPNSTFSALLPASKPASLSHRVAASLRGHSCGGQEVLRLT